MSDTTWLTHATCRRHNPEIWFAHATKGLAVHLCVAHCPVLGECRDAIDVIRPIRGVAAGVYWVPVGTRVDAPVRPSADQVEPVPCAACSAREFAELRRRRVAAADVEHHSVAVERAATATREAHRTRRKVEDAPVGTARAERRAETAAIRVAAAAVKRQAEAVAAQARRDERAAQVAAAQLAEAARVAGKHADVARRKEAVMRELAGCAA